MRLGILADIHEEVVYLAAALERFLRERVRRIHLPAATPHGIPPLRLGECFLLEVVIFVLVEKDG
jgi:hypothetical protein